MTLRDYIHPLAQLAAGPPWKWLGAAIGGASAAIWPEQALRDAVVASLCLVAGDTVLGVYAAWMSGEGIKSAKFRRVLGKLLAYTIVTAALWWGFRAIQLPEVGSKAATGAAGIAIVTELISIIENAHRAGMSVPKWVVSLLKGKLKEFKNGEPDKSGEV